MIRRTLAALGLMAMALPALSGPAHAASDAGDGFDVTGYALTLEPDIQTRTVAGRETITLRATRDGVQSLGFSAQALSMDSAIVNNAPVPYQTQGDVLRFQLPNPLAKGQIVKLKLSYHGHPARGMVGTKTGLYTSYFACDWMVCVQNAFGDKADFSLDLVVPAGMDTLSVGTRVARRHRPDGRDVHSWKAPRPYSAYLYGFAI